MKYELVIARDGSPLVSVEADTWKEIKREANKAGRELVKQGYQNLEVVWEEFPDKMYNRVITTFFPWEGNREQ